MYYKKIRLRKEWAIKVLEKESRKPMMKNCCPACKRTLTSKTGPDAKMEDILRRLTIAKARIVTLLLISAMGALILFTNKTMLRHANYVK